jgi:hypothetical protein
MSRKRPQKGCEFCGGLRVWPTILKLSAGANRKAAVAYYGSDAFLRFAKGDVLVVDASDNAIATGQTSASVLQRALKRGARVFSVPNLHAKVMVFGRAAIIGSANYSIRSARELIEAILMTDQADVVRHVTKWIDELVAKGQKLDSGRIQRLLSLESKREPIRRSFRALAETHLVFFKEVMAGDIEKYHLRSSTAGTGGGARDLRIAPADVFQPLLSQVISESTARPRVTHGAVRSLVGRGRITETDVELWPPTNARPNELRITRFYEVPGWEVSEAEIKSAQNNGERLFYVLEMDVHGTVTAKVLTDRQLSLDNDIVARHLKRLKADTSEARSIVGAVDVLNNVRVP